MIPPVLGAVKRNRVGGHRGVRAVTSGRVVTEGLVEEGVLGRRFRATGRASAKALGQPVLSTLALFMKAGTVSYCPVSLLNLAQWT